MFPRGLIFESEIGNRKSIYAFLPGIQIFQLLIGQLFIIIESSKENATHKMIPKSYTIDNTLEQSAKGERHESKIFPSKKDTVHSIRICPDCRVDAQHQRPGSRGDSRPNIRHGWSCGH